MQFSVKYYVASWKKCGKKQIHDRNPVFTTKKWQNYNSFGIGKFHAKKLDGKITKLNWVTITCHLNLSVQNESRRMTNLVVSLLGQSFVKFLVTNTCIVEGHYDLDFWQSDLLPYWYH